MACFVWRSSHSRSKTNRCNLKHTRLMQAKNFSWQIFAFFKTKSTYLVFIFSRFDGLFQLLRMGNKQAAFTENQLEDYQVSIILSDCPNEFHHQRYAKYFCVSFKFCFLFSRNLDWQDCTYFNRADILRWVICWVSIFRKLEIKILQFTSLVMHLMMHQWFKLLCDQTRSHLLGISLYRRHKVSHSGP